MPIARWRVISVDEIDVNNFAEFSFNTEEVTRCCEIRRESEVALS